SLSRQDWELIAATGAGGAATELWAAIAEAVAKSTGFDPGQAGFGRGHRIKNPARGAPAVDAAATALGLGAYDLYVAPERGGYARVVRGARPVLYLGGDVAAAKEPPARFVLARAIAHAHQQSGGIAELRVPELAI